MISEQIRQATTVVAAGGIVAYPTEHCYGLGCNPLHEQAVRRILHLKHRSWDKGLIVIVDNIRRLARLVELSDRSLLVQPLASWPGPYTWLLPALSSTPLWLRGRHDTLAVRIPGHRIALELCRRAGSAIVSTSANRKDQLPLRSAARVRSEFGDAIDWIIDGPVGDRLTPSVIRDAATGRLIRNAS